MLDNKKALKIWSSENGKNEVAYDFTGKKIVMDFYEDLSSNFCWTYFHVEKKSWITINCSTYKKMPPNIYEENYFFIDGKKYNFPIESNKNKSELASEKSTSSVQETLTLENEEQKEMNDNKVLDDEYLNLSLNPEDEENSNNIETIDNDSETIIIPPAPQIIEVTETKEILTENNNKDSQTTEMPPIANIPDEFSKFWNKLIGDQEVSYDYAGRIILKSHFRKKSEFSWDVDFYDVKNSSKKYIASKISIIERNKKTEFQANGKTFKLVIDDKGLHKFIDPYQVINILTYPDLLVKKIDSYFNPQGIVELNYNSISSILISLTLFPLENLEKLRHLLLNMFQGLDLFLDMFIYYEKNPINLNMKKNAYIRIYFKSKNLNDNMAIFDYALTARSIMKKVLLNLIENGIPNSNFINYDVFLQNHNLEFLFVSSFTDEKIKNNSIFYPKPSNGDLIMDTFYKNSFIQQKGPEFEKYFISTPGTRENNYICAMEIEKIGNFISKLSFDKK